MWTGAKACCLSLGPAGHRKTPATEISSHGLLHTCTGLPHSGVLYSVSIYSVSFLT